MNFGFFSGFSPVWNYFFTIPLPSFMRSSDPSLPGNARALTPLAGALLGLIACLPVFLLRCILGPLAAALAAGLALPLFFGFATGWKDLFAAGHFVDLRRQGLSSEAAICSIRGESPAPRDTVSMILIFTMYLFRAALLFILALRGAEFWFIVAMTGGFLVRAELTSMPADATGSEYFATPYEYRTMHWMTAFAAIFLAGLFSWHMFGALIGFAAAWGLSVWSRKYISACRGEKINPTLLSLFGFCSELCFLLLGALLYSSH